MSEISYKTIDGKNFMLIHCTETGKNIDTQIRMLTSGEMKGILPVTPTSKNGVSILQYDITGLTRLSGITQYGKLSRNQFSGLIEGLLSALDECSSYALSANGISLDNDCIYFDIKGNTIKFAYVPTMQTGEPVEKFKDMLRSFIAYGKVEHDSLTSSVADVINSPSFSFFALKDVLRKHISGASSASPHRQDAEYANQSSAQSHDGNIMPSHQMPPQSPPVDNYSPVGAVAPSIAVQRQPAVAVAPKLEESPMSEAKIRNSVGGETKNLITIIAASIISLALIVGACFTPVVRTADGGFDITKIFGIAILIGALDFLLLRNRLTQKNSDDVKSEITNTKETKKKTKNKIAEKEPEAVAAPMPGPAPFASPVSRPVQQPAAVQAQRPVPVFTPPAAVASPPVRTSPPMHNSIPEAGGDETVVFDEPDVTGTLYVQSANGEIIYLNKSPFLIGRDKATSDYALNDATVGRKHAEFSKQGEGWVIIDQNSRNHTYLNEMCISPYTPYPVVAGDTLRFANVTLWIKSK